MANTASPATLSIDVTKDLETLSDLKAFLSSEQGAIFTIAQELAQYAGQPIQSAVGITPAKLSLTGPASWKTSNGISFSLTPTASCTVSISNTSTKFTVTENIDSTDTMDIVVGPSPNVVYVNIDLDFDIEGSVSGSGTFSGVGVAGKASGSGSATLSFCQPVSSTTETSQALKEAFSGLVLPLDPSCALKMSVGSLTKVNFDGSINCEVDVTYGLGSYKVSAPDIGLVQKSLGVAWEKLTPPTATINAGAKASVSYKHSDHFGLIVQKNDANTATLYLVRSAENETGESVGVTVGISTTDVSLALDPTQITSTVQQVTGNSTLATSVGNAVAQPVNSLQTSLTSKLNTWISDASGQAGLTFSLAQQKGRTVLFEFSVDLTTAQLAKESWADLLGGSLPEALENPGFKLLAGSGVSEQLKDSSTIQLHFFNLFQWTQTTDYFSNAYVELASDGSIRFFNDIGDEQQTQTKEALSDMRVHFVATATEDTKGDVSDAEVDMYVELSVTKNQEEANKLASVLGMIPANAVVHNAQRAMSTYLGTYPNGTLSLVNIVKPSAYRKLSCSAYTGSTPPALPQEQDQDNWYAFQNATEALMPDLASAFVSVLSYPFWMKFNVLANGITNGVPDRRNPGSTGPGAVPDSFFGNLQNVRGQVTYFLRASADFMNLCDYLHTLANTVGQTSIPAEWNQVLQSLVAIVKNAVTIDYAKPAGGALLYLCSIGGAQVSMSTAQAKDGSTLTCTLVLS